MDTNAMLERMGREDPKRLDATIRALGHIGATIEAWKRAGTPEGPMEDDLRKAVQTALDVGGEVVGRVLADLGIAECVDLASPISKIALLPFEEEG